MYIVYYIQHIYNNIIIALLHSPLSDVFPSVVTPLDLLAPLVEAVDGCGDSCTWEPEPSTFSAVVLDGACPLAVIQNYYNIYTLQKLVGHVMGYLSCTCFYLNYMWFNTIIVQMRSHQILEILQKYIATLRVECMTLLLYARWHCNDIHG